MRPLICVDQMCKLTPVQMYNMTVWVNNLPKARGHPILGLMYKLTLVRLSDAR